MGAQFFEIVLLEKKGTWKVDPSQVEVSPRLKFKTSTDQIITLSDPALFQPFMIQGGGGIFPELLDGVTC